MENNIFLKKGSKGLSPKVINIVAILVLVLLAYLLKNSLVGYFNSMVSIWTKYKNYFISGIFITIGLSFISVLIGTIIGFLVYTMRSSKSKVLSSIAKAFVEIIRGTPLLVQLFIVFFGATSLIDIRQAGIPTAIFAFISGVVAVSINSGAYVSEIIRSGIQSVPKGQTEAGRSLGLSKKETMKEIIIPQAIKNILPALANEFITIIKETSIVSYIGVADIMYNVNIVKGNTFRPMESLTIAAIMYFLLTFTLSKLVGIFERRLKESD